MGRYHFARTSRNGRAALVLAIAALAGIFAPFAIASNGEVNLGTLSFVFENDLFYDIDQNYTSGLQISWAPHAKPPPDWAMGIARQIPWFPQKGRVHHGYAFGQSIFTPHDITLTAPPLNDRPYAGWLYVTISVDIEAERRLDQFALTLGVVGPASQAEPVQKLFHDIKGENEPRGWNTQLKNEPGIVVTYQRSWRGGTTTLAGLDLDLTPHLGGALGNIFTYANTGVTLRFGKPPPRDYGPLRIQPSLPGSSFFVPSGEFEWYLFSGIEGRAVARNIFLDGNTFRDSRSVEKEALVSDLQFGIVIDWYETRLSFTRVFRSAEFNGENGDERFGALSMSVRF